MAYRSFGKAICAAGSMVALASCTSASEEASIDQVRAVAQRYRDVKVAQAEGYTTDNKCVTAEMLGFPAELGAMGLHYVRRDMLGLPPKPATPGGPRVRGTGTHTDFLRPAMLVYEPQPDGSLQLVAVENLVFAAAWHKNHKEPPSFRGRTFDLLVDKPETKVDEAHGWEPHYEQHVWVFRDNPNGMLAEFNPRVTCRYHHPPQTAMKH